MRTFYVPYMIESILFISTLLHGLFVLFTQTWGNAKPWDPSWLNFSGRTCNIGIVCQ
jgi:hypothetical protein